MGDNDDLEEAIIEINAQEFTDIEKQLILQVVARDEDVYIQEKNRLGNLKNELKILKDKGVPDGEEEGFGRACKRCRTPLGLIFNSGAYCPTCGYKVCKGCRIPVELSIDVDNVVYTWSCTVCAMCRGVRAESGAWFYSGLERLTVKKKKVYGSMLMKRIFSISKKRDSMIYKDPVWNEIIEDIDHDDYVIIESNDEHEGNLDSYSISRKDLDCNGLAGSGKSSHIGMKSQYSVEETVSIVQSNGFDQDMGSDGEEERRSRPSLAYLAGKCDTSINGGGNEMLSDENDDDDNLRITNNLPEGERDDVYLSKGENLLDEELLVQNKPEVKEYLIAKEDGGYSSESLSAADDTGSSRKILDYENSMQISDAICSNDGSEKTSNTSKSNDDLAAEDDGAAADLLNILAGEDHCNHENKEKLPENEDIDDLSNMSDPLKSGEYGGVVSIVTDYSVDEDDSSSTQMSGEVFIGLKYDHDEKMFEIQVHKAQNLPPPDADKVSADPYVKVYMNTATRSLGKTKTKVRKNTLDPEFDEVLNFKVEYEELISSVLEVSVWHYQFAGQNITLGELTINMEDIFYSGVSLENPVAQWYKLHPRRLRPSQITFNGQMVINLQLNTENTMEDAKENDLKRQAIGKLHLNIIQAKGLKTQGDDLYVDISLIISKKDVRRMETKGVSRSKDPYWDEDFIVKDITYQQLQTSYLEIALKTGEGIVIGGSRLGLRQINDVNHDCFGDEIKAWQSMLDHLNEAQDFCIPLRSNLDLVKPDDMVPSNKDSDKEKEMKAAQNKESKPQMKNSLSIHNSTLSVAKKFLNADTISMASSGSMLSIYSNAGGCADNLVITGDILFSMNHNSRSNVFSMHFIKAKDIAAVNEKKQTSDPYVKTYLFPDDKKTTKKKTSYKKNTLNPEWKETIKYEKISREELLKKTLQVSIWNHDRFGRNDFLGEVQINIEHYSSTNDLNIDSPTWYTLQELAPISGAVEDKGELTLGICFDNNALNVDIKQASDLYIGESGTPPDSFVKCYLLPDKSRQGKRKTAIQKKTNSPVWNEEFIFNDVYVNDLHMRVLEVTVWDNNSSGHQFLGGLRLGLPEGDEYWHDCYGNEVDIWKNMMAELGVLSEFTIPLRSTMTSRKAQNVHDVPFVPTYACAEEMNSVIDISAGCPDEDVETETETESYKGKIKFCIIFEDEAMLGENVEDSDAEDSKKKKKKKANKENGKIIVHIKEAIDLPAGDNDGFSDPYCKCYLLPAKSSKTKRKTPIIKHSLNPMWDYTLEYQCSHNELMNHGIEFTIWDWDRGSTNDFIGGCSINLGTCTNQWDHAEGIEVVAWQHLIDQPNVWKEFEIPLHSRLDTSDDV